MSDEMNDEQKKWVQEYHERCVKDREERDRTNKETWKLVRAAFEKYGITEAAVQYDGSGDSGEYRNGYYTLADGTKRSPLPNHLHWSAAAGTEELEVLEAFIGRPATKSEWYDETGEWVTKQYGEERLENALLDLAGDLVSREHSGWENNEGGQGTVTFTRDGIKLHHEENIIEVSSYEYTYTFEEEA